MYVFLNLFPHFIDNYQDFEPGFYSAKSNVMRFDGG